MNIVNKKSKLNAAMKMVKALKTGTRKKTSAPPPSAAVPPKTIETTARARSVSPQPVIIEAKIDVGFGNALYLRGEGTGLSWNRGVPLTCVNGSTWKWSAETSGQLKFKLLLNDAVWAAGEDLVAAPGQKVELNPVFS